MRRFDILAPVSLLLVVSVAETSKAGPLTGFDVAEDPTRRVILQDPAPGRVEVSQGYIYPKGTLAAGQSGVLVDGHPAFPEQVIGTWRREARRLGGPAVGVAQVISHQVFALQNGDVIVTEGVDGVAPGDRVARAVTGATGDYAMPGLAMEQVVLGQDESGALRARFHLDAQSVARREEGFDAD